MKEIVKIEDCKSGMRVKAVCLGNIEVNGLLHITMIEGKKTVWLHLSTRPPSLGRSCFEESNRFGLVYRMKVLREGKSLLNGIPNARVLSIHALESGESYAVPVPAQPAEAPAPELKVGDKITNASQCKSGVWVTITVRRKDVLTPVQGRLQVDGSNPEWVFFCSDDNRLDGSHGDLPSNQKMKYGWAVLSPFYDIIPNSECDSLVVSSALVSTPSAKVEETKKGTLKEGDVLHNPAKIETGMKVIIITPGEKGISGFCYREKKEVYLFHNEETIPNGFGPTDEYLCNKEIDKFEGIVPFNPARKFIRCWRFVSAGSWFECVRVTYLGMYKQKADVEAMEPKKEIKVPAVDDLKALRMADLTHGMSVIANLTRGRDPMLVKGRISVDSYDNNVYVCHDSDDFHGGMIVPEMFGYKHSWRIGRTNVLGFSDCLGVYPDPLLIPASEKVEPKKEVAKAPVELTLNDLTHGMHVTATLVHPIRKIQATVDGVVSIANGLVFVCHGNSDYQNHTCLHETFGMPYGWEIGKIGGLMVDCCKIIPTPKAVEEAKKEIKERESLAVSQLIQGMEVSAMLYHKGKQEEVFGKIHIANNCVFLCHNNAERKGAIFFDQLGYKYSWCISAKSNMLSADCTGVYPSPVDGAAPSADKPQVMEYLYKGSTYRSNGRIGVCYIVDLKSEIAGLKKKIASHEEAIANWELLFGKKD